MLKKIILLEIVLILAGLNVYQYSVIYEYEKPRLVLYPPRQPVSPAKPQPQPAQSLAYVVTPALRAQITGQLKERHVSPAWAKQRSCELDYARWHPEESRETIERWCTDPSLKW